MYCIISANLNVAIRIWAKAWCIGLCGPNFKFHKTWIFNFFVVLARWTDKIFKMHVLVYCLVTPSLSPKKYNNDFNVWVSVFCYQGSLQSLLNLFCAKLYQWDVSIAASGNWRHNFEEVKPRGLSLFPLGPWHLSHRVWLLCLSFSVILRLNEKICTVNRTDKEIANFSESAMSVRSKRMSQKDLNQGAQPRVLCIWSGTFGGSSNNHYYMYFASVRLVSARGLDT